MSKHVKHFRRYAVELPHPSPTPPRPSLGQASSLKHWAHTRHTPPELKETWQTWRYNVKLNQVGKCAQNCSTALLHLRFGSSLTRIKTHCVKHILTPILKNRASNHSSIYHQLTTCFLAGETTRVCSCAHLALPGFQDIWAEKAKSQWILLADSAYEAMAMRSCQNSPTSADPTHKSPDFC